jgi:hypothetical protein
LNFIPLIETALRAGALAETQSATTRRRGGMAQNLCMSMSPRQTPRRREGSPQRAGTGGRVGASPVNP